MGQGIISISQALFETPQEGYASSEQEPLKQPETLAEWHTLLMLPGTFKLLGTKKEADLHYWSLTVENDAIPVIEGKLLNVELIYGTDFSRDDGTSTHYLDRIEVYVPERKAIWQRSEQ